jgi:hypothetical protein
MDGLENIDLCASSHHFVCMATLLSLLDTLRKRAWPKLVGLHKYCRYKPHFYKPKPQTAELLIEEDATPKFEFDTSAMNFEMIEYVT